MSGSFDERSGSFYYVPAALTKAPAALTRAPAALTKAPAAFRIGPAALKAAFCLQRTLCAKAAGDCRSPKPRGLRSRRRRARERFGLRLPSAGIDLSVEAVPDATTLLKFPHLLEAHDLTRAIFAEAGALLSERKLLMREGTIVDATIIAAPSSTKNARKEREEIVAQGKEVQWYVAAKRGKVKAMAEGLVKELTLRFEKAKAQVRARVEHPLPAPSGAALRAACGRLSRSARLHIIITPATK